MVPNTPLTGQIEKWIIENAVANKPLLGTQYPVGTNSAPQDYTTWKLSDEQVRKLANYLLGGGQIENLKSIEAELSRTIKNLLGTVDFKEVPFDKINQLHEKLLDLKKGLMEKIPEARIDGVQHGLNFSAAGINLLLAKVTYDNAYSAGAGIEAKLRAHSLAIGVFSDVANTIAKFKGVETTLVRTVAHKAGGRLAMSLGALQFIGGGVGGVLGAGWFFYDFVEGLNKGLTEHALLDIISVAGCAVSTAGLMVAGTGVGIPVGVVCNIVGFSLVLVAQLLKHFRAFITFPEEAARKLIKIDHDEGGADSFEAFKKELSSYALAMPTFITRFDYPDELIDRVYKFLMDWDTFDSVRVNES